MYKTHLLQILYTTNLGIFRCGTQMINNNILFYSANIQFNKNLFSALYKKKMCSTSVNKNMKIKNNIHNDNRHIKK